MRRNALAMAAGMAASFASPVIAVTSNNIGPGTRVVTRSRGNDLPIGFIPANINRHTGKPHEHKREIARRLRQPT